MPTALPIPILLLNWNGLADTRECLACLRRQTFQNYIVYLLDNGSEVAEAAVLRSEFGQDPHVRLHFSEENLGFTRGNNLLLRQILAQEQVPPYVVLLNNDTAPDPEWLAGLVTAGRRQGADMVASKMVNYYDRARLDNAGHQLLNTLEVLPLGHDEPAHTHCHSRDNMGPCAGAGLYSTAMLRSIGLFDEHFRNGYEDVELGLRGIMCGYRSVFAPRAVVYHKISRSVNKIRDFDYTLAIQCHIYYVMIKLTPAGAALVCLPFFAFRTAAAMLVNVLFLRRKYLRIQLAALAWLLGPGWRSAWRARRAFFRSQHTISSLALLRKMDFFLKKDLQRFYKYLIRREKMVFEKYE